MGYEVLLLRVMHRTGWKDRVLVQEGLHKILRALGGCFGAELLEDLSAALPETMRASLKEGDGEREGCALEELYRGVSDELGMNPSMAMEFTQVVMQVVAECLKRDHREQIQKSMSAEWAALLEPRTMAPVVYGPRERDSLAEGRPGSHRSLSEARPGHQNSIAFSDDPEKGRKISTSAGKPSRRTLAEGKPGSSRPLSE